MFRTFLVLAFSIAALSSPLLSGAEAQTARDSGRLIQVVPGGGGRPTVPAGKFTPVPRSAESTVNCGSSVAHYQLCTEIKATCDAIHENAPNHPCGCTTDGDGNLDNCNTGL